MRRLVALLALIAAPVWGAMNFNGSTDKAESSTLVVTGAPLSICCLARSEVTGAANNYDVLGLHANGDNANWFRLHFRSIAGVGVISNNAGSDNPIATQRLDTTTNYSANTYYSVCAIFTSLTSRDVYLDNGGNANGTTSIIPDPAKLNRTAMGFYDGLAPGAFFDGDIAECGIWNVALSAADLAALAARYAPPCVRRDKLLQYFPSVRDASAINDTFGTENPLTLTGGTVNTHPRVVNCQ